MLSMLEKGPSVQEGQSPTTLQGNLLLSSVCCNLLLLEHESGLSNEQGHKAEANLRAISSKFQGEGDGVISEVEGA